MGLRAVLSKCNNMWKNVKSLVQIFCMEWTSIVYVNITNLQHRDCLNFTPIHHN